MEKELALNVCIKDLPCFQVFAVTRARDYAFKILVAATYWTSQNPLPSFRQGGVALNNTLGSYCKDSLFHWAY